MNHKAKKGPIKTYQGTSLTTDQEELKFRKQRGQKESMDLEPLKDYPHPFDNYLVHSSTGLSYTVEIRSLVASHNSCSCPDFLVNNLGTCKHIEKVLYSLSSNKKATRHFPDTSQQTEIFLNASKNNEITIHWPSHEKNNSPLRSILSPYFSDSILIQEPISALASIQNALSELSDEQRSKIRISPHLVSKIKEQERNQNSGMTREQFMNEVKEGTRSLRMVNANLYPYQEEGMLHLAFQKRALLADEMGLGKTIQAIAACEMLRRLHGIQRAIVVCPASLKGEWEEQLIPEARD